MDFFDPFILILAGQLELRRTMDLGVIKHMKLAGAPETTFSDDALKALYEVTYGIPRRIGAACETALTFAMLEEKKTIDADLVLKAKAGG